MGNILLRSVWENTVAKVQNVAGAFGCCNSVVNALRNEVLGGKQNSRVQITLQAKPLIRPQSVVCMRQSIVCISKTMTVTQNDAAPSTKAAGQAWSHQNSQISTIVRPTQHPRQPG